MDDTSTTTTFEPGGGPRPARRRRWLLVGVVLLVGLAAVLVAWRLVGGGDLQRLARAPDATVGAGTARVDVIGTVEGVPVLGPFTLTVAAGEVDLVEQRASLRRDVPGVSGVPLLNQLLPEAVEIVHDGRDTYLRLPIGGERAWVRVGEGDDDPAGVPEAAAPGLTNPVAALGLLRALEGPPEVVGQEAVQGQPSTHFRVLVDLERAADALTGRADDMARTLQRLRGRSDLPLDVWLDGEDRVTRLRYALEPDLPGLSGVTVTTDLELSDFGAPVDIRTPRPHEIVSLPTNRVEDLDPFARLREFLDRR